MPESEDHTWCSQEAVLLMHVNLFITQRKNTARNSEFFDVTENMGYKVKYLDLIPKESHEN